MPPLSKSLAESLRSPSTVPIVVPLPRIHGTMGVITMCITVLQPLNAVLRPHKAAGEAKSTKRVAWEFLHKGSGAPARSYLPPS